MGSDPESVSERDPGNALFRDDDSGPGSMPNRDSGGGVVLDSGSGAEHDSDRVVIYTDGACAGNPGPGGWGAILLWRGEEKKLQGGEADTTNNRMELTAAIRALEALKRPCRVELYSDSAYLINAFSLGWVKRWQAENWRLTAKNPVKNRDLWLRLCELDRIHRISWHKVKGHSSDVYNALCDAMAVEEAAKFGLHLTE